VLPLQQRPPQHIRFFLFLPPTAFSSPTRQAVPSVVLNFTCAFSHFSCSRSPPPCSCCLWIVEFFSRGRRRTSFFRLLLTSIPPFFSPELPLPVLHKPPPTPPFRGFRVWNVSFPSFPPRFHVFLEDHGFRRSASGFHVAIAVLGSS